LPAEARSIELLYEPDFENPSIFSDIADADQAMMGGTPYAHAPSIQ
jgi:hypothetical protein